MPIPLLTPVAAEAIPLLAPVAAEPIPLLTAVEAEPIPLLAPVAAEAIPLLAPVAAGADLYHRSQRLPSAITRLRDVRSRSQPVRRGSQRPPPPSTASPPPSVLEGDGDGEHDQHAGGHAQGLLQTLARVALLAHLGQHADQRDVDEATGGERQDPRGPVACRQRGQRLRGRTRGVWVPVRAWQRRR